MPRMLREIVTEVVSSESDLEIVEALDLGAALATMRTSRACVVLTRLEAPPSETIDRFLDTCSHVRILALSSDGRDGAVYELRPRRRLLGEVSPSVLLVAIRETDV